MDESELLHKRILISIWLLLCAHESLHILSLLVALYVLQLSAQYSVECMFLDEQKRIKHIL